MALDGGCDGETRRGATGPHKGREMRPPAGEKVTRSQQRSVGDACLSAVARVVRVWLVCSFPVQPALQWSARNGSIGHARGLFDWHLNERQRLGESESERDELSRAQDATDITLALHSHTDTDEDTSVRVTTRERRRTVTIPLAICGRLQQQRRGCP